MTAVRNEVFFDRLPDEVEIRNAEQLRTIVASQMKEGEPTTCHSRWRAAMFRL